MMAGWCSLASVGCYFHNQRRMRAVQCTPGPHRTGGGFAYPAGKAESVNAQTGGGASRRHTVSVSVPDEKIAIL